MNQVSLVDSQDSLYASYEPLVDHLFADIPALVVDFAMDGTAVGLVHLQLTFPSQIVHCQADQLLDSVVVDYPDILDGTLQIINRYSFFFPNFVNFSLTKGIPKKLIVSHG